MLNLLSTAAADVQQSQMNHAYDAIAKNIWDILDKVEDKTETAHRRWVWELMQNAKDTANHFGQVSVAVELLDGVLTFSHNGDAFEVDHITGLIQQNSSKDFDNADDDVTGKYGTGFISTHVLSGVIKVTGVVKRPEGLYRHFSLELDRRATRPKDMIEPIRLTMERAQRLDDNDEFPIAEDYLQNRVEHEETRDTTFRYELGEDAPEANGWQAARTGLADLATLLPVTLINNQGKINGQGKRRGIKKVCVRQEDGSRQTYHCEQLPAVAEDGLVSRYQVTITDGADSAIRYFLAYETTELRLVVEVKGANDLTLLPEYTTQVQPKNQRVPTLWRDFPLVGSDNFYFPFLLNGKSFHPHEARDGIKLNEGPKARHNRDLLMKAVEAALAFTDWLVERKAVNGYRLAVSRLPVDAGYSQATLEWYRDELQKPWRTQLLDKALVEVANNKRTTLRLVRIPRYQAQPEREQNRTFWKLAADYFGHESVPRVELLESWIDALGVNGSLEEYASWGHDLFLSLKDLFEVVAGVGTLAGLPGGEQEGLAWLNRLYAFAAEQQELDGLLKKHAVVPDQWGKLRLVTELRAERLNEQIPEPVLLILKDFNSEWRGLLMNREVVLPGYEGDKLGLKEAASLINVLLTSPHPEEGKTPVDFLSRTDVKPQDLLVAILSLTTDQAKDISFRRQMLMFGANVFGFTQELTPITEPTNFMEQFELPLETAARLMGQLLNKKLAELNSVKALAEVLKQEPKEAVAWLSRYLGLLAGSDKYKVLLLEKGGNLVPNWLGDFCPFLDLYNFGTPEQQDDSVAVEPLLKLLPRIAPMHDWQPRVLKAGMSLRLSKQLSFVDLGNELINQLKSIFDANAYGTHKAALQDLMEWCDGNETEAKDYLRWFVDNIERTFYTLNVQLSGNSAAVMRLLRQPTAQLNKLADLAKLTDQNPQLLADALAYAHAQAALNKEWETNFETGRCVEKLVRAALEDTGLDGELIRYQGSGDCDYVVQHPVTKQKFYLEVKSYREGSEATPLHLAISQATRAASNPDDYALCVVPHPGDMSLMNKDTVAKTLKFVPIKEEHFKPVVERWGEMDALAKPPVSDVRLEVEFGTHRVRVTHDFVATQSQGRGLQDLVAAVRARLGV